MGEALPEEVHALRVLVLLALRSCGGKEIMRRGIQVWMKESACKADAVALNIGGSNPLPFIERRR